MNISIFSREINSTFGNMKEFKDFLVSLNKIFIGIGKPDNILNLKIEKFIEDLSILKEKYKKNDLDELSEKHPNKIFSCEEIDQIIKLLSNYKEINQKKFEESEEFLEMISTDKLKLRTSNLGTKEKAEKLTEFKNEEEKYKIIIENYKKIDSVLEKIESFRIKFNETQKNKTDEVVEKTGNQVVGIIEEKPEIVSIKEENKTDELIVKLPEEKQENILSEEEKIINEINFLNAKDNNDEIINKVFKLFELGFDKEKLKEIVATKIYLNGLRETQNKQIVEIHKYIYGKEFKIIEKPTIQKIQVKKRDKSVIVANKLKNIDERKEYLENLKETENFDEIYEYLKELRKYQLFPLLSLEIIELLVNNEKEYELNSFFNAIREKGLKAENPDFKKFGEKCVQLEDFFGNKILVIEKVGDKVKETGNQVEEIIEKKGVILTGKEIEELIDDGLKNIDIFVNLKKFAEEKNISGVYSAILYAYNLGEKIDIKEIEKILKKLFEDTKNTENKKDLEYINELKYLFGEIYFK